MSGAFRALLLLTAAAINEPSIAQLPLIAQRGFEIYEGPDAIKIGEGGTKVVKDGVDFWTSGSPPRRYKILGVITDKRLDDPLVRGAIGSSGTAKKVKQLGGDAVVVVSQISKIVDSTLTADTSTDFGGDQQTTVKRDDTRVAATRFLVVKYLDE